MSNYNNIWIVSESLQDYAALCKLSRKLSDENIQVTALWIGSDEGIEHLKALDADSVYFVETDEQSTFATCSASVLSALTDDTPDAIFCAISKNTRLLAAQMAARLETRVLSDVTSFSIENGELYAEHMVYGGSANRREHVVAPPAVLLLSESLLLNNATCEVPTKGPATVVALPDVQTQGITLVRKKIRDIETVNLAGAQVVLSVGRGIEKEEDLQMVRELAQCLQGEIGCTRPIAEGVGWMSHERYIGVSGALLKPELFIAIGLSGQIQHMVGAYDARTIVAINNDKNAPIFKMADYGITGDLYEVLPKLTEALK